MKLGLGIGVVLSRATSSKLYFTTFADKPFITSDGKNFMVKRTLGVHFVTSDGEIFKTVDNKTYKVRS